MVGIRRLYLESFHFRGRFMKLCNHILDGFYTFFRPISFFLVSFVVLKRIFITFFQLHLLKVHHFSKKMCLRVAQLIRSENTKRNLSFRIRRCLHKDSIAKRLLDQYNPYYLKDFLFDE